MLLIANLKNGFAYNSPKPALTVDCKDKCLSYSNDLNSTKPYY